MEHKTKLHEALATLKAGRAIVSDPSQWCQRYLGKSHDDSKIWEDYASCYDAPMVCSWGAVSKVKNISPRDLGYRLYGCDISNKADCSINFLNNAVTELYGNEMSIVLVNDVNGHDDTIAMWDRAIANCEKAISEYETGLEIEKDMETNNGTR